MISEELHELKVAGKRNRDAQSTDDMILSKETCNPVPSMKRTKQR